MMYQNKLVACIKVDGKILKEQGDTVTLPFGSEYNILLKNLSTVRAQVRVSIDGEEKTGWLIIGPNDSLELERSVKDLNRGNRFKFIERTDAIEEHQGIRVDDGLVRVEYRFEKEKPVVTHHYHQYHYDYYGWPYYTPCVPYRRWFGGTIYSADNVTYSTTSGGIGATITNTSNLQGGLNAQAMNCSLTRSAAPNDAGITVPGSESTQKFVEVAGFDTEASQVIVLKLRGRVENRPVQKAYTVRTKEKCQTCGLKSEGKFCPRCGTSLNVV